MGGITAKDILLKIGETSPELAAVLVFLILAIVITWKVSNLVAATTAAFEKHEEKYEALKAELTRERKQRHKIEQLLSSAACVSKNNGLWLQDETRNGGQPPEPIKCLYQEAKRKVEI